MVVALIGNIGPGPPKTLFLAISANKRSDTFQGPESNITKPSGV